MIHMAFFVALVVYKYRILVHNFIIMTFHHKKHLGQNFLTNPQMQTKIIQAFESHYQNQKLIEIGPGLGDLTKYIGEYNPLLLEIDSEAVAVLGKKFPQLETVQTDALELIETHHGLIQEPFYLFSNLPYNVGSRILMALGKNYSSTPFTVILQQEVAYKTKVSSHFTFFGAWLNYIWDTKVLFSISKGNFSPPPKVDSAILQGTPKIRSTVGLDAKFTILKKLFTHPKKTLYNNLKQLGWNSEQIQDFFENNSLEPNTRLNWHNYAQILDAISLEK